MVGARLDYCNSILYGTSAENLGKIRRVINTLARVFSGARKRDHITPLLADLHWLPISSRIYDSKSPCRHTKRLPQRNQSILPILSVSRLHRDHSGLAQRIVSVLSLPGLASPVALFVMRRRPFRMLFLFRFCTIFIFLQKTTQNIFVQTGIPSMTALPIRTCDSIYSYNLNKFSLTYGASPAVYYYYYY